MASEFRPRHYSGVGRKEPMGVMQRDDELSDNRVRRQKPEMSETILRLAHAEYERQYSRQDYERMQERGGLSVLEVVRLLADYVERLGGTPSKPRQTEGG